MRFQKGAALIETAVVMAALLFLGLGGVQLALLYNAKSLVNYATFEAARRGALEGGSVAAMKDELALRLLPFYGGGQKPGPLAASYVKAKLDLKTPALLNGAGLDLDVLNPTREAFQDHQLVRRDGTAIIPNDHLRFRSHQVGAKSGMNIQDANLLKIRVTYGYRMFVPFANKILAAIMKRADPGNLAYYSADPPRFPLTETALIRMQSEMALSPDIPSAGKAGGGGGAGGGAVN